MDNGILAYFSTFSDPHQIKNPNLDPHQGDKPNLDPHQGDAGPQHRFTLRSSFDKEHNGMPRSRKNGYFFINI
jgi:hypothetical protein